MLKKVPHTYAIIVSVILFCAVLSWVVPAGEYERQVSDVNGVKRTVIVPGSFHRVEAAPQTWQVFSSLLNGFEKQAGIIAFLLIIGGAFQLLNSSKAIDVGILSFLRSSRRLERYRVIKAMGVERVVLVLVMVLFSLFGAVFGMSEETLAFVIILVPLAISMGYDSITGLCMVYVAAHVGFSGAVLNPFTIGIAQGISDLPLFSGFEYRLACWCILTCCLIVCVLRYAGRIKRNPARSPMYRADDYWRKRGEQADVRIEYKVLRRSVYVYFILLAALVVFSVCYPLTEFRIGSVGVNFCAVPAATLLFALSGWWGLKKSFHFFILVLLAFTIVFLIIGVLGYGWYLSEISALFLAMGVVSGYAAGQKTDEVIKLFQEGAKDMLSVAIVVALAGGIIQILQDGKVIDPILHALASGLHKAGKVTSVGVMYGIQTLINIIIPSGSAKAALTMPIMAPFSDVVGISRQATVMAYQFGDGFTNMITPTSPVLIGALGIARIPYDVWVKWFGKLLLLFILLGFLLLLPSVLLNLPGY
ncbi:YfcC family protein [Odoribacter lunatus]|uniref:YfcC family protein n=1 Tax=Odoribacter lunatus TaxID=2941335 RepID=UPI00203ECD36|nr:AbgT family transporter [Odoribacter lunatus]